METSQLVVLDSRDRAYDTFPTPGEYVVRLPRSYKNVVAARLLTVELPLSFYVFRSSHTTSVRINDTDVSIAPGNYTALSLQDALDAALVAAFPSDTFHIAFDLATLKFSISREEGNVSLDASAHASAAPTEWGLAYFLGFDKAVYAGPAVQSPRVVSVNPQTYLLLDIPELNGVDESSLDGGEVGMGCFAKVPFTADSFKYVTLDFSESPPVVQRPRVAKLDKLRVRWRWHDGAVVDFNGVEHSLTIQLFFTDQQQTLSRPPKAMQPILLPAPGPRWSSSHPPPIVEAPKYSGVLVLVALAAVLLGLTAVLFRG